jgi:hypothetical protein
MDPVTTSMTTEMPTFRGMSRAQADFKAIEIRQQAATGQVNQNFGFADFIDLINPLQHLPVIGDLYREATGDTINPAVKLVGGGIFGGPLGLISGAAQAIFEQANGEEVTQTIAGWFGDDAPVTANPTAHENIQLTDIQWNAVPVTGFAMAAATPAPSTNDSSVNLANKPAVTLAATAQAAPTQASPLFDQLQKGVMPASYQAAPTVPEFFKSNAAQFEGIKPAALKTPSEDTTTAPQSDFAKKMMDALDRYNASKAVAPATAPVMPTIDRAF